MFGSRAKLALVFLGFVALVSLGWALAFDSLEGHRTRREATDALGQQASRLALQLRDTPLEMAAAEDLDATADAMGLPDSMMGLTQGFQRPSELMS